MSYTSRGIKFGKEGTFGTSIAATVTFNNALAWEAEINETLMEEELVSGERDAVSRAALQREVTGRIEGELINAKLLYYAMGSISSETSTPYTILPSASIPSLTLQRMIGPSVDSIDNVVYIYGTKLDSFILNLEVGEEVTYEIGFMAQDGSLFTADTTAPSLVTITPLMYYHGMLTAGGATITELQSCIIEINNNLTPRYSADSSQTKPRGAYSIKEGRFQIGGRFTTGGYIEELGTLALEQTSFTLELTLIQDENTITLTMPNVQLSSYPDVVTGREPYEIEFPFIAAPETGLDALKVVENGGTFNNTIV